MFCTLCILWIVTPYKFVLAGVNPINPPSSWCYDGECGPKNWPGVCNDGQHQSPINIVAEDVVGSPETRIPVKLCRQYCVPQEGFYVENNGHTIMVMFGDSRPSYIDSGEAFPHKYKFAQLHIHWGPRSGQGSEHQINGKGYVMEMHIVHTRVPYTAIDTGSRQAKPEKEDIHDSDIAVVSVLFKSTPDAVNYALEPIIEAAIIANGTRTGDRKVYKHHPLNLYGLFPANKTVYQYQGSLTTPPCTQTVWWTMFEHPVPISDKQVETLQGLNDMAQKQLTGNFRAPQPLNGRKVQHRTLEFSSFCEEEVGKYFERIAPAGTKPTT